MWPRRWEGRVFDQFAEAMNLKSQGCPSILMGDKHADFTSSRVLMWGLYHNLTWFDSDKWFKHWVFTSFTVQIWECCFKQTGIAWFAKEMVEQPSQKPLFGLQNFKQYFHLNCRHELSHPFVREPGTSATFSAGTPMSFETMVWQIQRTDLRPWRRTCLVSSLFWKRRWFYRSHKSYVFC